MTNPSLRLTGNPEADRLLTEDDNALLLAMVLDQQVPMEKAFSGPLVIAQRMGGRLDVTKIASMSEDEFIELCSQRPAIHRFPAAMARRIRQVCQVLTEDYDGQAANLWRDARSGDEVRANLGRLPGFGPDKAAIFTAVLGKLRGITPEGWRTAAGYYGEPDTFRSVADIVDYDSLQKVRETKKSVKAAKKASSDGNPAVRTGP
ncbi:MAG TPA: HhH-GPD-type base excision DNA repair protein [Propionibacteriaceae bacterium]